MFSRYFSYLYGPLEVAGELAEYLCACFEMFKESFKYYKRRCPPPCFDSVINLNETHAKLKQLECIENPDLEEELKYSGLKHSSQWKIFELIDHPGLIIIKDPFTEEGSCEWIERCLTKYPGPPNKSNLHSLGLLRLDENWWDVCQNDISRRDTLIKKQRWVTLGYHHDWDSKVYSEDSRTAVPEELVKLVHCLGKAAGGWDVVAEAAILNFYRTDSTLSGHTDHSEPNATAPLFSLSFGQSAIFLIGGKSIDDPASAVLVNSGDVMIMSGESRLCYHGVPRIVPANFSNRNNAFFDFLKNARINLNIRQVLQPGQKHL